MQEHVRWTSLLGALAVVGAVGCGAATTEVVTTPADVAPPQPPPEDPGAVELEGALSNRFVLADEATTVTARLRIVGHAAEAETRPPINLALAVDTSGSMEGEAIDHARGACLELLEMLSPGDRLAVVAFDSRTRVLVPSTPLDAAVIDELREEIGQMEARGTTDLSGGLAEALRQVQANASADGINRIVLLSDGVPNDPGPIEGQARAAASVGVAITALGLGLDYDETLLGSVASLSGGRFHYLESSDEVASVFREEVLSLRRTIGRNAVVTIQPGPGIAIERVLGLRAVPAGRGVQVSIGDLIEGRSRDVFVQLAVTGRRAGSSIELLDALLTFDDAVRGAGRLERSLFLGARATDDRDEHAAGRNDEVVAEVEQVIAAEVTVEAIRRARAGRVEEARALVTDNIAQLDDERSPVASSAAEALGDLDAALSGLGGGLERGGVGVGMSDGAVPDERPAPARAPAPIERSIRGAHERAMNRLLGQKC